MTREELIDLALNRYFKRLDARDFEAALSCFQDDATFTVYPVQKRSAGKAAIRAFLEGVLARHASVDRRVREVAADEASQTIIASFEARFTSHAGHEDVMFNVNVWQVRDGLFQTVSVYVSSASFLGDQPATPSAN
jgi:uncharacterized protein (TIGR02246 family)